MHLSILLVLKEIIYSIGDRGGILITVCHVRTGKQTVYIGRGPGGRHMLNTPIGEKGWLGNPHSVDEFGRDGCIELFRVDFKRKIEEDPEFKSAVLAIPQGSILGCFCKPLSCHGDVIAEFINSQI